MAAVKDATDRIAGRKSERLQNSVLVVGMIAWAALCLYVVVQIL